MSRRIEYKPQKIMCVFLTEKGMSTCLSFSYSSKHPAVHTVEVSDKSMPTYAASECRAVCRVQASEDHVCVFSHVRRIFIWIGTHFACTPISDMLNGAQSVPSYTEQISQKIMCVCLSTEKGHVHVTVSRPQLRISRRILSARLR